MSWLSHPYRPSLGRTATCEDEARVRELLELVLFTSPGERVNRPDFGCGLNSLLFLGNSPELALTVELSVRAAVQRWLGELLAIEALSVTAEESTLTVDLSYRLRGSGKSGTITVSRSMI